MPPTFSIGRTAIAVTTIPNEHQNAKGGTHQTNDEKNWA